MKLLISGLTLLLLIASCGQRQGSKTTGASAGLKPGWSVMIEDSPESTADEKTEMPDYIKVSRTWKDIPNEAFIGRFPTEKEITRWKKEFEKAHAVDSVWHGQLGLYKDAEQYICDVDFVELLHGRFCEEFPQNDRRTEWRLLQYGYDSNRETPVTELGKVMNLKGIYEDVLDSELGSQMDMNLHSWLVNDFQDFYIRLLYDVCSKKLSSPVAQALRAEQAAAKRAHAKTSAAYRKIDGSPSGFDGSSYPYRVASFGSVALDMELNAQEAFLKAVLADSLVSSTDFVPIAQAKELVQKEYDLMLSTFKEEEESFPVKERKDAMEQDKAAFHAWMAQRERVSSLLSGNQKETYDNATVGMYRHKLIMLKNRYESGCFVPEYYLRVMLPYEGVTTEQILSHNFEKLLEEELSK